MRERAFRGVAMAATLSLVALLGSAPAAGEATATTGLRMVLPDPQATLLPPLSDQAPMPKAAALGKGLQQILSTRQLGSQVTAVVLDAASGEVLYNAGGNTSLPPASTSKIMTAVAALSVLGGQSRLATTAVRHDNDRITLVGGGDVLLGAGKSQPDLINGHAGIGTLARQTAAVLKRDGVTSVRIELDDTRFRGPGVHPAWSKPDMAAGYIAPVAALAMDAGNSVPGKRNPKQPLLYQRTGDPAMATATAFAAQLKAVGITVSGAVTRSAAPAGAQQVAAVHSAPIADVVEYMLADSDNVVAEVLARLVAISSNGEPTFTGGGTAVLNQIHYLGIATTGMSMAGGSGLAKSGYQLSAMSLASALYLAAHDESLRSTITGLPVAGGSGTLRERFTAPQTQAARGVARAKTGSLTGVNSLAGTVVDADGRLLVYAVLATGGGNAEAARGVLDRAVGYLAACGCR